MDSQEERLLKLREEMARVDVHEALRRQRRGAVLLDVREAAEWAQGSPPDALQIARSGLEFEIEQRLPDRGREILLLCAAGSRALLCADTLARFGYQQIAVVDGGMRAWLAAQLPVLVPDAPEAAWQRRYARQIVLPEVGLDGQRRLAQARVLVIGAGGLGSPVALYLAAAGVGTLRIVDDDQVEISNLQRQVLHTSARVGRAKVESATETLNALNPTLIVEAIEQRVSSANIDALVADCDVWVDGSDNLPTRYLLSDAAVKHGKPLVYGAVERFSGQVSVFHPGSARGRAPCYRCLFPEPPPPDQAPNCAEVGVIGVVPGIVGLLQANEAIKLLLGIGESLVGRLLLFDALAGRFRELTLRADPDCAVCATT
ncbi:MAG TPA: molybdopterin-synthase adenylyltransferase MoeB, partial [Xanthomonadales bacterium]|nr:molybdopterin-synthase adenylyltransferase MoeB [Xanthomonadales bacterium]